jgi:hypothetical protein
VAYLLLTQLCRLLYKLSLSISCRRIDFCLICNAAISVSELLFGRATLGGVGAASASGDRAATQNPANKQRSLPVNVAQAEHKQMLVLIKSGSRAKNFANRQRQKVLRESRVYDISSEKFKRVLSFLLKSWT